MTVNANQLMVTMLLSKKQIIDIANPARKAEAETIVVLPRLGMMYQTLSNISASTYPMQRST